MRLVRSRQHRDAGLTIIEVLVALTIFALTSAFLVGLGITALRTSALTAQRLTAAQAAQSDVEIARTGAQTKAPATGTTTRSLTVGDVPLTVTRTVTWLSAGTATSGCGTPVSAAANLAYLSVVSKVTWPQNPTRGVTVSGLIYPGAGIVPPPTTAGTAPTTGVTVRVSDADEQPVSGTTVTVAGPGTGAGSSTTTLTTDATGCTRVTGLAAGSYTVTASQTGYTDPSGATSPSTVLVVTGDPTSFPEWDVTIAPSAPIVASVVPPAAAAATRTAPTFKSFSTPSGAQSTTAVLNTPSPLAAGDLMIAAWSQKWVASGTPMTAPAGWTLLRAVNSALGGTNTLGTFVYYKFAAATEPATYTWTTTNTNNMERAGTIFAFSGVDQTTPIDAYAANPGGTLSVSTATAPSVTTTVPNTTLVTLFGGRILASATVPTGETKMFDFQFSGAGNNNTAMESGDTTTAAAAGATPTYTATFNHPNQWVSQTIALRGASSGGGGGGTTYTIPASGIPTRAWGTHNIKSSTGLLTATGTNTFAFRESSGTVPIVGGTCADSYQPGSPTVSAPSAGAGGTVSVPLGGYAVTVKTAGGAAVSGAALVAVHEPDSGCPSGETYTLPATDATGVTNVALPFGTWTFRFPSGTTTQPGFGQTSPGGPTTTAVAVTQ